MRDRALAGRVRLTANDGALRGRRLILLLMSPPQVAGGAGGWETVERPGRRPAKWWKGGVEITQTLECCIDRDRITDELGTVERRMARLDSFTKKPGGDDHPTSLLLAGDVLDPYTAGKGLWVITNVTYGERVMRPDGDIARQMVSIDLADFTDVPTIAAVRVTRTRASASKAKVRKISTRKGDTIRAIAVRELGSSAAWTKVRDWNPRLFKGANPVGPDTPLRAGVTVTLK